MLAHFERFSAQIQRALFSHDNPQQPLPNNDLEIAVEKVKAPPPTKTTLLLLLLLVPSPSVLPYYVAGIEVTVSGR